MSYKLINSLTRSLAGKACDLGVSERAVSKVSRTFWHGAKRRVSCAYSHIYSVPAALCCI